MQQFMSKGHGAKRKVHPLTPKKVKTSADKSGTVTPDPNATRVITNEEDKTVKGQREDESTHKIDAED